MVDSFNVDPVVLSVALGAVLPILVGVVTKAVASSGLQAVLLAFLSTVTGVLSTAQTQAGFVSKETLIYAAAAWVMAVASHYGFHKPTGITNAVQTATANFGIGSSSEN